VASVQGAAAVARRGLLSPVRLNDRSGENVLLRKGIESRPPGAAVASSRRNPAASGQGPHPSSQSPKSAFFQLVPNPRSPISPSSISGCTPGRPFYLPAPGLSSPPQVSVLSRRSFLPRRPPPQVHPCGCLPAQVSLPCLRAPAQDGSPPQVSVLRLRSTLARRLRNTPLVPPGASLPSPLRVLFEAPSSLPQGALSSGPQSPPRVAVPRPLSPLALLPRKRSSSRGSLKPLRFRKQHTCSGPQVW